MDIMEAIRERHSVRRYTDKKIEGEVLDKLKKVIDECNKQSGLNIQLITDEPDAFDSIIARYGSFRNVKNYVALVGDNSKIKKFDESCGYFGEKIVLAAAQLGLNTCWVAATFSKKKCKAVVGDGEKLHMVIAIGYGENNGIYHEKKPVERLYRADGEVPDWFMRGMEAARLAPTAINRQRFLFELSGNTVQARALSGPYVKTDLGIVKYHFEVGAGKGDWKFAD
jgi:hypothetical protein